MSLVEQNRRLRIPIKGIALVAGVTSFLSGMGYGLTSARPDYSPEEARMIRARTILHRELNEINIIPVEYRAEVDRERAAAYTQGINHIESSTTYQNVLSEYNNSQRDAGVSLGFMLGGAVATGTAVYFGRKR